VRFGEDWSGENGGSGLFKSGEWVEEDSGRPAFGVVVVVVVVGDGKPGRSTCKA